MNEQDTDRWECVECSRPIPRRFPNVCRECFNRVDRDDPLTDAEVEASR